MNGRSHWSLDRDPPRDDTLARLLRAADRADAGTDWERLHAAIMRGVVSAAASSGRRTREWWDVLVQWGRVAVAASLAAMLAAGALLWRADGDPSELALTEDAAPESVAIARVVAAYPDDAVLTSLLQTARDDEFTSWGTQ